MKRNVSSARRVQHVVIKLVLFVPKPDTLSAEIVHGGGDAEEMLEKLGRDVFVNRIFTSELERDPHHVEAKHSHPAGAIALLEPAAVRERGVAVEYADIIEPEKTALENVVAFGIFAVHPPGEGDEHLVENSFQKCAVALAALFSFDLVNAPRRPGDNGRINVAKIPLVGGDLAVGVLVPFAHDEIELGLRKCGSTSASGMQ